MLLPEEFALFSAILGLSVFIGSPLNAVLMVVSQRVSIFSALNRSSEVKNTFILFHKSILIGSLCFLAFFMVGIDHLKQYLKSDASTSLWIFSGCVVSSAFIVINNAFFQGFQRFWLLGIVAAAGVGLKIIFSVFFVSEGLGVNGALVGVLAASTAVVVFSLAVNSKAVFGGNGGTALAPGGPIGSGQVVPKMNQWLPTLVANMAFSAMTQLDVVIVNYYFAPAETASYAAASVLGKAVLYLPGGFAIALFPLVAEKHAHNERGMELLGAALRATLIFCAAAAAFYFLFADWLVVALYGPAYKGAAELLKWYGFCMVPMALVMVAEHFLIAKGQTLFAWIFLAVAPIQILIISQWHTELWMVMASVGASGLMVALSGYIALYLQEKKAGERHAHRL
jgi:O-antigen/teichoic acid export membrane protein